MASEELIPNDERPATDRSPEFADEPQLEPDSVQVLFRVPHRGAEGREAGPEADVQAQALGSRTQRWMQERLIRATETEWRTRGAGSADVELSEGKKESVDVELKPRATVAAFFLLALPKGQCTCVGTAGRIVECACLGDEVEIKIEC